MEKHIQKEHPVNVDMNCDVYGKTFNVKWKLNEAAHNDKKIYCHFFNNDVECSFSVLMLNVCSFMKILKYADMMEIVNVIIVCSNTFNLKV